jgi:hypothetical protein
VSGELVQLLESIMAKAREAAASPGPAETAPLTVAEVRQLHGLPVDSLSLRLQRMGVPEREAGLADGRLSETPAMAGVRQFFATPRACLLVLGGGPGVGKSLAAAWALSRRPGLWVDCDDLARPPADNDPGQDRRIAETGLLVLDDLGGEHSPSGYAASRIQALIGKRYAALRPTIATTNKAAESLSRLYGDRVMSRLRGDPLGLWGCGTLDLRTRPA